MPSIFTSTKVFNRSIDHQSTSNDRLKPVMTTGLVNMHIDRSIANLVDDGACMVIDDSKYSLVSQKM